ncbi:MAG TPA: hypothetical protein VG406_02690 [Isosphaeraceae bacterium]|nr:hypothetical protein [Isosphaeraceae bacterium]
MKELTSKWSSELPDRTRRRLITALLMRLDFDNKLHFDIPNGSVWILGNSTKPEMEGLFINQNLAVECGRSAWAIEEILGCALPPFTAPTDRRLRDEQIRRARAIAEEAMAKRTWAKPRRGFFARTPGKSGKPPQETSVLPTGPNMSADPDLSRTE